MPVCPLTVHVTSSISLFSWVEGDVFSTAQCWAGWGGGGEWRVRKIPWLKSVELQTTQLFVQAITFLRTSTPTPHHHPNYWPFHHAECHHACLTSPESGWWNVVGAPHNSQLEWWEAPVTQRVLGNSVFESAPVLITHFGDVCWLSPSSPLLYSCGSISLFFPELNYFAD